MSFNLSSAIKEQVDNIDTVTDTDWVRNSLMVKGEEIDATLDLKRYYSSADAKMTDSSLGGAFACNARTQYTRYSDCRRMGRRKNILSPVSIYNSEFNLGMGQFYSEHLDDHAQLLFLEFGVAKFNSIANFLAASVDQPTSVMAKHAAGDSMYQLGKAIGTVAQFLISKTWTVIALAVYGAKTLMNVTLGSQHAKFYWLKPAMHVYWNTVNNLVSATAMEIGLVQATIGTPPKDSVGAPVEVTEEDRNRTNNMFGNDVFGDIVSESGQIDVRKLINRANRTVTAQVKASQLIEGKKQVSSTEWEDFLYGDVEIPKAQPIEEFINDVLHGSTLYQIDNSKKKDDLKPDDKGSLFTMLADGSFGDAMIETLRSETADLKHYLKSAMAGGARYAVFEVQYMGSQTVSFTNRTKDIPTKAGLNTIGGKSHDIHFATAGMNLIGAGLEKATMAVSDLAEGILSKVTFGASNVLIALLGGGFIEMPQMWDDSEMSAVEHDFKMRLSTPYHHPMAEMQKKYIPMHMILAGALPLSTGKASYVSPLLCNAYLRGSVGIELGMIVGATITTEVGNIGKSMKGRSLAYDMTFKIRDFTTLLSAPISSMAFGSIVNSIDESSAMGRFLAKLGSRDIYTTKFTLRRAGLRLARLKGDFERATDNSFLSTMLGDMAIPVNGLFLEDLNSITVSGNS